jgi:glycerol kinase
VWQDRRTAARCDELRDGGAEADKIRAMERAGSKPLEELRVDGAATVNRWLMQFQADVLGTPVVVPEIAETTAMGAALLAGVGANLLTLDQVAAMGDERARYEPRIGEDERASLLDGWHRALERSRDWASE